MFRSLDQDSFENMASMQKLEDSLSASLSAALEKRKVAEHKRLWEDDLGTMNVPSLYNRMNFATVPRKNVNKKTCGLYAKQVNEKFKDRHKDHHHLHCF